MSEKTSEPSGLKHPAVLAAIVSGVFLVFSALVTSGFGLLSSAEETQPYPPVDPIVDIDPPETTFETRQGSVRRTVQQHAFDAGWNYYIDYLDLPGKCANLPTITNLMIRVPSNLSLTEGDFIMDWVLDLSSETRKCLRVRTSSLDPINAPIDLGYDWSALVEIPSDSS